MTVNEIWTRDEFWRDILYDNGSLWPLLLKWFNLNPNIDK